MTHRPSVHCNHAKQVAEGPCAAENPLRDIGPGFCENYKTTCADASITPAYADCKSTLAANAGGMTW